MLLSQFLFYHVSIIPQDAKTPCLRKVLMLGGGGEIRTPAPGLPGLTI